METAEVFDSSDSVRSGRPLRYAQRVTFPRPVELETGGRLPEVTVVFETYGRLNARRDNAVLVCHALSGDSHVARQTRGTSRAGGRSPWGRAGPSIPIAIS